jgi:bla regulator protein blaR1
MPSPRTLIALAVSVAFAQTAAPPSGFEVVSVKPSDPSATGMQIGVSPGGVFDAKNVTLKALIRQAYDVRDFQISPNPAWRDNGWFDSARYDIIAKGNTAAVSEDDLRKMTDAQRNAFRDQLTAKVRILLADRFQLKVHKETKEMPVYALTVAKNGPKFQPSANDDVTRTGLNIHRGDTGKSEITATRIPVAVLVKTLSDQVGRTVLDQTGLQGNYDFKLTFTPDMGQPSETDGPSIFTALQEQLGLRLDSQKGPVEVLVIDNAQRASEN